MNALPKIQSAPVMNALAGMRCDGGSAVLIGCFRPVKWGVRIHVPSKTQTAPAHAQVRVTLPFHVCDEHRDAGVFTLDRLLVAKVRADVEDYARKARPIDWKADFDAAFIQYVDVFSPEYKRFIAVINSRTVAEAKQLWGPLGHV